MSKLREAAKAALTAYEKFRDVDDIDGLDDAMDRLRAALAQPKTELRDQHKAFTHWYFGLRGINEANFSPEDLAWAAWKAALAQPEPEPVVIGPEWTPCVKLPITVHVREQRPDEQHVSTREGITPVKPDDLIMRGVAGEEYPIGRELFEKTYRIGAHPPRDEWRSAVHEELFTSCIYSAKHARDPRAAIRDIIDWNVRIALDPAVSSDAQALIDKGRAMRDEWRPVSEPPESPPHAYLIKKLAMVMPLFEEARDALTAISEQQRAVRCISPTLADRMDAAGTYSIDDWRDVAPPSTKS